MKTAKESTRIVTVLSITLISPFISCLLLLLLHIYRGPSSRCWVWCHWQDTFCNIWECMVSIVCVCFLSSFTLKLYNVCSYCGSNLGLGIGIQNFPEGLAVSLPLRAAGTGTWTSFWYMYTEFMITTRCLYQNPLWSPQVWSAEWYGWTIGRSVWCCCHGGECIHVCCMCRIVWAERCN